MIETIRLIAAGLATAFFIIATFIRIRPTVDQLTDDMARAGRWTAAGTMAAAVVFGCEVAAYFWPGV